MQQENRQLQQRLQGLRHQLEWLKRQVFGEKSERRLLEVAPTQMSLGDGWITEEGMTPPPRQLVGAHTRRPPRTKASEDEDEVPLFFDERVPVELIEAPDRALEGLGEDEFEVIG